MPATPATERLPDADYDAFAREIFALRDATVADLGARDRYYLYKMIAVNRLFTLVGYLTAWLCPNPLSAYCISQGLFGRWMEMHHIGHGGYDEVPGMPTYMHSKRFALGWRRFIDWFDWIIPAAWNHEHNVLHHHYTSEPIDPDLVEDHCDVLRESPWPRWLRLGLVAMMAVTWKFSYYAPNTLRVFNRRPQDSLDPSLPLGRRIWTHAFDVRRRQVRQLWLRCYLPYLTVAFVIIPLLFYFTPFGWWAVFSVLVNRLLAEAMTNFHAFLVVGPNHTGDDLYRFEHHFSGRAGFCVNQVISACNYPCGTFTTDYLHGWLNYQIEHHLYPRLPNSRYAELQPKVKALCAQYRVPYVQESVFKRFRQLVRVMVGDTSLRTFPAPGQAPAPVRSAASAPRAAAPAGSGNSAVTAS